MNLFIDGDPESFGRFFPDLEDVEIRVWQLDGEEQASNGAWLLTGAGFPDRWQLVCGEASCQEVFDPRGAVYARLHGHEDAGEGVERCRGTGPRSTGTDGAGGCGRSWQYTIRLRRKPGSAVEHAGASGERAEPSAADG